LCRWNRRLTSHQLRTPVPIIQLEEGIAFAHTIADRDKITKNEDMALPGPRGTAESVPSWHPGDACRASHTGIFPA
jgi:hypothetical protein